MSNLLESLPFEVPPCHKPRFDTAFRDKLMHRDVLAESVLPGITANIAFETPENAADFAYGVANAMMKRNRYAIEKDLEHAEKMAESSATVD